MYISEYRAVQAQGTEKLQKFWAGTLLGVQGRKLMRLERVQEKSSKK